MNDNNGNPDDPNERNSRLQKELEQLDTEWVEIEGRKIKPSQCYHVDLDPLHVLFNTNCPDDLKQKVEAILSKFDQEDEGGA
jgi:hypothetical protein